MRPELIGLELERGVERAHGRTQVAAFVAFLPDQEVIERRGRRGAVGRVAFTLCLGRSAGAGQASRSPQVQSHGRGPKAGCFVKPPQTFFGRGLGLCQVKQQPIAALGDFRLFGLETGSSDGASSAQESPDPGAAYRAECGPRGAACEVLVAREVQPVELDVVELALIRQLAEFLEPVAIVLARPRAANPACSSSASFPSMMPSSLSTRATRSRNLGSCGIVPRKVPSLIFASVRSSRKTASPAPSISPLPVFSWVRPVAQCCSDPQMLLKGKTAHDKAHNRRHAQNQRGGGELVAARPFGGALPERRRAGLDHLSVEIPIQVVGKCLGRRVAPGGVLVQALEADRLEVARHPRDKLRGGHRVVVDDLPDRLDRRFTLERRAAGEHLVQDGSQGINVGRRPDVSRMPFACSGAM